MSLKNRTGVLAWVLLSGLFFTGPILLADGILPSWAGIPVSLIPCFAIALALLSSIKTQQGQCILLAGASVAIFGINRLDLLKPEYIFLTNFTVINGVLFWIFGRTLRSNSIPLCTRFADLVHETMSPEIISYSRGLTYVWAAFFATQVVLWIALFFTLSASTWYQLISITPPTLIIILFVLDWVARQFLLPDEDKKDALQLTIRAIIKHRQGLGKTFTE